MPISDEIFKKVNEIIDCPEREKNSIDPEFMMIDFRMQHVYESKTEKKKNENY